MLKSKRGRPRNTPDVSYEMRMKKNKSRNIKKPKYLLGHSPVHNNRATSSIYDDRGPYNGLKNLNSCGRNTRGYNVEVEDKNSDFHYGSDFETEVSDNEERIDSPLISDSSDEEGVISDDGSNTCSNETPTIDQRSDTPISVTSTGRPNTPDAIWLQDKKIKKLTLPPSADDLLIPVEYLMPALTVYEVLKQFSVLLRLSPYRFEDFCGALINPKKSILLTEVHISLLRALIREDDQQSTHFGPLDQKDSINVTLFLIDPQTWPRVLYTYLQSDMSTNHEIVSVLESCNYPYTTLQNRLQVLRLLSDAVLCVSGIREELVSEGKIRYDDHCRKCHKTGDLLCCDSCSAVYHLGCLEEAPSEHLMHDWTCPICVKNQVYGVNDCLSTSESSGNLCRQDPLGYDRYGRKYWFLVRRLIIESPCGRVWYYSTIAQLKAVLSLLDYHESELYAALEELERDLHEQMEVTTELTDGRKGERITALDQDSDTIVEAAREQVFKAEPKTEVKQEDELGTPGGSSMDVSGVKDEVKDEVKADDDMTVEEKHKRWDLWGHAIVGRSWLLEASQAREKEKVKLQHFSSGGQQLYRLGSEGGHNYQNLYTCNALALNKLQHNEEKDKKRHLSHKFSINVSPEFKWTGLLYGSEADVKDSLRACLQTLEQNVSVYLFHPNWPAMRKTWLAALATCSCAGSFSRCMVWLVAAVKPTVFHSVWHEALGYVRLHRVSLAEREERRRQDKRERKEGDDEASRTQRPPTRYRFLPKHQLWKVKGEEYRATVGDGWLWMAGHRRARNSRKGGLRGGPTKVMVAIQMADGVRGLPVTPEVFRQMADKTPALLHSIYSPKYRREQGLMPEEGERSEIIISHSGADSDKQMVEVVPTQLENYFEDGLVNVSKALGGRTRLVYPKLATPTPTVDSFLARRQAMPRVGDRKVTLLATTPARSIIEAVQEIPDSQRSATHRLRPAGNLLKEIRNLKIRYEALDENLLYRCYSSSCWGLKGRDSSCYSPMCRLKNRTKQKLLSIVKNYTIVTSQPSPYGTVGINDIINLADINSKHTDNSDTSIVNSNASSNQMTLRLDLDETSQASVDSNTKDDEEEDCCSGKVRLRKQTMPCKANKTVLKLPQVSTCRVGKDRYSPLVLPQWELKVMCRRAGKWTVSGFNASAKANSSVWPYPCARPTFRHLWHYRTATINDLATVALQIRIVWACLRWEEIQERGPSDSKKQITTDSEIVQTEILKRKFSGRFNEKTEYLRRKVTIPLDAPKAVREFTPSQRSGLRKRRRTQQVSEAPLQPESIEEWVGEEQLSLWEIRQCGERLERATHIVKTTPSIGIKIASTSQNSDLKTRMEETLKQQRVAFQQKQRDGRTLFKISSGVPSGTSIITSKTSVNTATPIRTIATAPGGGTKKLMRTKDGRIISVVQQTVGGQQVVANSTMFPISSAGGVPTKIQIAPQNNKIIRLQTVGGAGRVLMPRSPAGNVQVVRLPSGQLQVKGLAEGQQVVQRPDGKLQVLPRLVTSTAGVVQVTTQQLAPQHAQPHTVNKLNVVAPRLLAKPQLIKVINGQPVVMRTEDHSTTHCQTTRASDGTQVRSVIPVVRRVEDTKTSFCIKVQVKMTNEGPKTIISGMPPGTGLSKEHIREVQQQVRTMLSSHRVGVGELSPIMSLTLHHHNQSQPESVVQQPKLVVSQAQLQPRIVQMPAIVRPKAAILQPIVAAKPVVLPTISPHADNSISKPLQNNFSITGEYIDRDSGLLDANPASNNEQSPRSPDSYLDERILSTATSSLVNESDTSTTTGKSTSTIGNTTSTNDKNGTNKRVRSDSSDSSSKRIKRPRGDGAANADQSINRAINLTISGASSGSSAVAPSAKRRRSGGPVLPITSPRKKSQHSGAKLEALLNKHKELLKKDILRKRAVLEKNLQQEIHKEISAAKHALSVTNSGTTTTGRRDVSPKKKRKLEQSSLVTHANNNVASKLPQVAVDVTPVKKHGEVTPSKVSAKKKKAKKIVCVCRTVFDDTKFYVGCDLCANWFHGSCVGISERMSASMTEYVCAACVAAKRDQELYCFCRQPYDETQFYIGCEGCEDWYHGRCVGILQREADDIDDYMCPKCEPNNAWNRPCQRKLAPRDYVELRKLLKKLMEHKNAWPFMDPVDPHEAPDYHRVVTAPIDLRTIDKRLQERRYDRVVNFVSDVMLLFDNCRLYNSPTSSFASCATTLESFFASKLKLLKQKFA